MLFEPKDLRVCRHVRRHIGPPYSTRARDKEGDRYGGSRIACECRAIQIVPLGSGWGHPPEPLCMVRDSLKSNEMPIMKVPVMKDDAMACT